MHATEISTNTGPTTLQWFLMELDATPLPNAARGRIDSLLRSMVGQSMYLARRDLVTASTIRRAQAMLDAGKPAKEVRAELAASGNMSRRTAERMVATAIQRRAKAFIEANQLTLDLCGGDHGGV